MAIRVAINHKTEYRFDRLVKASPHVVRLRPAPHSRTPIESYSLKVLPEEHFINWQQDPFGNYLARLVFPEPMRELSFEVDVVANIVVINPFDFFVEKYAEKYPFAYPPGLRKELAPYLEITEDGPRLQHWLSGVDRSRREVNNFLVDLNQRLEHDIDYTIRMEPGIQNCEETLDKALGSCRDTGWLLVADPASPRTGGTLRLRLPAATDAGRKTAGRSRRHRSRLHRPACLGRGLHTGRRLAGTGSDLGPVRRRGSYPAGLHAPPGQRRTDHRRDR